MTENALLDALRNAKTPIASGEGMRVEEIRKELGISAATVRNMIREGLVVGTVRRTVRHIEGLGGQRLTVPGYAIVKKKK